METIVPSGPPGVELAPARRAQRILVDWPAVARRFDATYEGRLINVSDGGALLVLPYACADENDVLSIEVEEPGGGAPLVTQAIVRWRSRLGLVCCFGLVLPDAGHFAAEVIRRSGRG